MRAEPWRALSAGRRACAVAVLAGLAACSSPGPALNAAQQAATSASQGAARALERGELAQARSLYERALAAAESVEDFQLAGAARLNLALVHARAGDLPAGHAQLDRVLAAPQRYGQPMVARAATRKALLYLDVPDLDAASSWAATAQSACAASCELAATLADVRAHVALQRGDWPTAVREASHAVELAARAQQGAEHANALRLLGRARSKAGQPVEAASALAQALAIDQRLGLPERVALDLVYAADNEQSRQQTAAAREFFERALTVYQAAGHGKAAESVRARLASLDATSPRR